MPGPAVCNKITDPVEKKKCLNYEGKYAKNDKANPVKGSLKKSAGGY